MVSGSHPGGQFSDETPGVVPYAPKMVLSIAEAHLYTVVVVGWAEVALDIVLIFGVVANDQEVPRIGSDIAAC